MKKIMVVVVIIIGLCGCSKENQNEDEEYTDAGYNILYDNAYGNVTLGAKVNENDINRFIGDQYSETKDDQKVVSYHSNTFDIYVDNQIITSIKVKKEGPHTEFGLEVGWDYDEVMEKYDEPNEASRILDMNGNDDGYSVIVYMFEKGKRRLAIAFDNNTVISYTTSIVEE